MKKGKINILAIQHKNGKSILRPDSSKKVDITENDVNNFDKLVLNGSIIPDAETKKIYDSEENAKAKANSDLKKHNLEKIEATRKANLMSQEIIKNQSSEIEKLKKANTELVSQIEKLKKANVTLEPVTEDKTEESKDLTEQLKKSK